MYLATFRRSSKKTELPWKWRQQVLPTPRLLFSNLHCIVPRRLEYSSKPMWEHEISQVTDLIREALVTEHSALILRSELHSVELEHYLWAVDVHLRLMYVWIEALRRSDQYWSSKCVSQDCVSLCHRTDTQVEGIFEVFSLSWLSAGKTMWRGR